jgi:hypothetical protein
VEASVKIRFCDEFDGGFGWIVEDEWMERCSHALVTNGRVWVIDPVDGAGVAERIRAAGVPAGVLQLLDRHNRDSRAIADRLGVPLHVLPNGTIPPFQFIRVVNVRRWREVALWWAERRVLVVAEAVGSARPFVAPGERLGIHPALRLTPPRARLRGLDPQVVLCGHGEGVVGDASPSLQEALMTARRSIPRLLAGWLRFRVR